MRVVCTVVAATLVMGGCRRDHATPAAQAPADGGPTLDAVAEAADGAVDAVTLGRTPISPGAMPPPDAPARARVVGGVEFHDAAGGGAVYLLEVASPDRRTIVLQARVLDAAGALIRVVNDRADACPGDNLTGFTPPTVTATDLDRDGRAELGFGYVVGCAGAAATVKQLVLIGDDKYIVRGDRPDGGAPEPGASAWPAGVLDFAMAGYRDNAGALDVGAARGADDLAIYDATSPVELVPVRRRVGAVEVSYTYPKLTMVGAAEAIALSTQLRRLLEPATPFAAGVSGQHAGRCDLTLLTAEAVSLDCQVTPTLAPDPATADGVPGPRRRGFVRWRSGDRGVVTLDELGVAAAQRALAGTGCAWVLTRTGVAWRGPDGAAAPCPPDRPWSTLTPTSPRAQRLVTRLATP